MELLLLRSVWSGPHRDLPTLIAQTIAGGFGGLEGPLPADSAARHELRDRLRDDNLAWIAEVATGSDPDGPGDWWLPQPERTVTDHLADLEAALERACDLGALFVSTMCGSDAWSWEQHVEFFGRALEMERAAGLAVGFETHRGRSLFNPWLTRDLLREFPEMKLTCDFSHWCVVCERLIDTEAEVLALCFERALHVHGRVGYAQHAQVSDPRAPEYAPALEAHERWWSAIWADQARRGWRQTTLTPEFLWDGYLQVLPYTQAPVADLWEITCWMGRRQQERFAEFQ